MSGGRPIAKELKAIALGARIQQATGLCTKATVLESKACLRMCFSFPQDITFYFIPRAEVFPLGRSYSHPIRLQSLSNFHSIISIRVDLIAIVSLTFGKLTGLLAFHRTCYQNFQTSAFNMDKRLAAQP
jgi:hypothetical protein